MITPLICSCDKLYWTKKQLCLVLWKDSYFVLSRLSTWKKIIEKLLYFHTWFQCFLISMKKYPDHTMDKWSEGSNSWKIMFLAFKGQKAKPLFSYFLSRALEFCCNLNFLSQKRIPLNFLWCINVLTFPIELLLFGAKLSQEKLVIAKTDTKHAWCWIVCTTVWITTSHYM